MEEKGPHALEMDKKETQANEAEATAPRRRAVGRESVLLQPLQRTTARLILPQDFLIETRLASGMTEIIIVKDHPDRATEAKLVKAIRAGAIIVYPTDTVYGIGCNARNSERVKKIREIKKRGAGKPFSVIAPSDGWITRNCVITQRHLNTLSLLPGPYTLIFELKKKRAIAQETNAGKKTLGIRIPKHWISRIVRKAGTPLVTTSVNESGEQPARTLEEIERVCDDEVDLIFYDGAHSGKPSRVIDLTKQNWRVTRK